MAHNGYQDDMITLKTPEVDSSMYSHVGDKQEQFSATSTRLLILELQNKTFKSVHFEQSKPQNLSAEWTHLHSDDPT